MEGKSFDDIVKEFKPHHMSKIKKAEKFGIIIKDISYDDLPTFKKITEQTSKLIGFSDRSVYKILRFIFKLSNISKIIIKIMDFCNAIRTN